MEMGMESSEAQDERGAYLDRLGALLGGLSARGSEFELGESLGKVLVIDGENINVSLGSRLTRFTKGPEGWVEATVEGEHFSADEMATITEIVEKASEER